MRTLLLRVVAEPPQIFWAPLLPAAANLLLQTTAMLFAIVWFGINPMPFFITAALGHLVLAGWAAREPHLSGLFVSFMETKRRTVNLLRAGGNKYVA